MLKLYNTLANKKEPFKSIETGKVRMYTCGPTVYNYAHIGNLTAYTFADTLKRYLEFKGYEVRHIFNFTDVGHLTDDEVNQADTGEDKMLKAALKEKKTPLEIANFYIDSFFDDAEKMNFKKAQFYPRATAHIPQMIKIIEMLVEKGFAYEKNGNVFFDVEKFEDYGKLSNKKIDELKHGARLEEHPDKKHPYDFALWLKAPKEHALKWESPWSLGYPGWHIECTAMSMEYLGETLDIHTGAEDNIFPHHENEIAQSEAATGKPFSNFWLHLRHLLVDGAKMSKSKGNFYILHDIIEKGYDPMAFRLLILSSHYRSNINFTWKKMDEAQASLEKITRFVNKLQEISGQSFDLENREDIEPSSYLDSFTKALDDDLNTPLALSVLYDFISQINKDLADEEFDSEEANAALATWEKMNKILGLKIKPKKEEKIPGEVLKLLKKRDRARKEKRFEDADQLRDEIGTRGYVVEDTPDGQKVAKKNRLIEFCQKKNDPLY